MPNRITGMYSGLDTESLIRDLVKAKSTKVTKLKAEKTKAEWKQEQWSSLNTKLKNLFSKTVNSLRYSSDYSIKKTTVSNPNAVSVITGTGAMNSVQKLSVISLASTGYLTGDELTSTDGTKLTSDSKLSGLSFKENGFSGSGSFDVTVDGKTTTIEIDSDTTIAGVVSKLNAAGVSASFDEKNQRLFIGAKKSGETNDFTITANDADGNKALSALGINTGVSDEAQKIYADIAALGNDFKYAADGSVDVSSMDKTSAAYIEIMANAKEDYTAKVNTAEKEYKSLESEVKTIEDKIKKLEEQRENDTLTSEDIAKIDEELSGLQTDLDSKKAELDAEGPELETMKANLENEDYGESLDKAIKDLKSKVDYAASVNASDTSMVNKNAVKLAGSDAEIELNGAKFTSSTNNVEVNGLTFTCNAVASDITVTTQDDTDGLYDKIKSFLKEYNEIINEMDKLLNTKVKKGYNVLTDDEKDAMSDKEVEKWESTIKESLLNGDDNLRSVFNGMRETMLGGIKIDGKDYYLSSFGINTPKYLESSEFERNAYHIDGDTDDSVSGGNNDVLKTMIANDSDTVISFFTQLANNLYKKMDNLSASSDYSSFGSFYDDKKYKTDMTSIERKIAEAEEKLAAYEDRWYAKFAAMEKAMSKSDSSNQYLSGLFASK